jgi:hypothetical protein
MNENKGYNVRFLKHEEYQIWSQFVVRSYYGTIYNSVEHMKSICDALKIQFDIVGCFDKNNVLIAGIAFGHSRKFGKNYLYNLPITPYCNIVFNERETNLQSKKETHHHSVVNELLNFLEANFSYIKFSFNYRYPDVRPYTWSNYLSKVNYTYLINLQEDHNPDNYDPSLRRQLKKGYNLPYRITDEVTEKSIYAYYDLHLKTYRRQGLKTELPREGFRNYIENVTKNNQGTIYSIEHKGIIISSMVILFDPDTAYYTLSATDPEYFSLGLNHVLLDQILTLLKEKKVKYFDFIGANTPSISRYKAKYNFKLVPIYSVEKTVGFSMKVLLKLKQLYVRL